MQFLFVLDTEVNFLSKLQRIFSMAQAQRPIGRGGAAAELKKNAESVGVIVFVQLYGNIVKLGEYVRTKCGNT